MKAFSPLTCVALMLTSFSATGAVNFVEKFEFPVATPAPGVYGLPTDGDTLLDNPGWEVVNSDDPGDLDGLFVTSWGIWDGAVGDQVLGLGGGNTTGSSISILISGFDTMDTPSISFDHFTIVGGGGEVQTMIVTVTDPENGDAILREKVVGNTGSVSEDFDTDPFGDTVRVTITQGGNTNNSDNSIDNLTITAVPEPSLAVLGILAALAGLNRRRH